LENDDKTIELETLDCIIIVNESINEMGILQKMKHCQDKKLKKKQPKPYYSIKMNSVFWFSISFFPVRRVFRLFF